MSCCVGCTRGTSRGTSDRQYDQKRRASRSGASEKGDVLVDGLLLLRRTGEGEIRGALRSQKLDSLQG